MLVLVVAVLCAVSLSGCLKIRMEQKNVKNRLTEDGYQVVLGNPPLSLDEEIIKSLKTDGTFTASKTKTSDGSYSNYVVYAYFCSDTTSADRIETLLNDEDLLTSIGNGYTGKKCYVYRYDNAVFMGDVDTIALIRGY